MTSAIRTAFEAIPAGNRSYRVLVAVAHALAELSPDQLRALTVDSVRKALGGPGSGRQRKATPELLAAEAALVGQGARKKDAARLLGVHESTVRHAKKRSAVKKTS